MYTKLCNTLGVALCLLGLASPLVLGGCHPPHPHHRPEHR